VGEVNVEVAASTDMGAGMESVADMGDVSSHVASSVSLFAEGELLLFVGALNFFSGGVLFG
jgi:hypothetical protein